MIEELGNRIDPAGPQRIVVKSVKGMYIEWIGTLCPRTQGASGVPFSDICMGATSAALDEHHILGLRSDKNPLEKLRKTAVRMHAAEQRKQKIGLITTRKRHTLPYGRFLEMSSLPQDPQPEHGSKTDKGNSMKTLTHLERLEAESIHIIREVVAEAEKPVMLYSVGKDSAVMLHLARKAFYPSPPPFPLLHVDTTWKFKAMYELRDQMAELSGMDLLVYQNPEAAEKGINPFDHGSLHTDMWKTEGLKQALDKYGFDAAFGGARRDEEKSRAKERIFSFRTQSHGWDPKNQRPELWNLYNAKKAKGESIRVFPISNWTELDIWQYIHLNDIPIVPLYFADERPTVERDGMLVMVDDERFPLKPGEQPVMRSVRFRTLGCYPLTGAVESTAKTLPEVIQETLLTTTSERQGRAIDKDAGGAGMEVKKQQGYF
jgi:sulfate adenylyltransferase, small subunit